MTGQERGGAVSAPMAVAVLVMLITIGLAVDGVRAVEGFVRADAIAEEAARAAAQSLDSGRLQRGQAVIDPAAAAAAVHNYLAAAGASGEVAVAARGRVRVDVRLARPTVLLGLIGRSELTSTGSAEAEVIPLTPDGG